MIKIPAFTVVFLVATGSGADAQDCSVRPPSEVAQVAAAEHRVWFALHDWPLPDSLQHIIQPTDDSWPNVCQFYSDLTGLALYQEIALDTPGRLYGWAGNRAFCLGGCFSVDLPALVETLGLHISRATATAVSKQLAIVADPNGAYLVLFARSEPSLETLVWPYGFVAIHANETLQRWRAEVDTSVFADTLMVISGGHIVTRVNVLTFQAGFAGFLTHLLYVFDFDPFGNLVAWRRLEHGPIKP